MREDSALPSAILFARRLVFVLSLEVGLARTPESSVWESVNGKLELE